MEDKLIFIFILTHTISFVVGLFVSTILHYLKLKRIVQKMNKLGKEINKLDKE